MGQNDFVPTIISRFAATSLFLYDIILTIDDEITYVWSAKWTLPKVLYLWVRYPGILAQLFACIVSFFSMSNDFCFGYGIFNSTWLLISAGTADGLLVLRVLALVKGRRRLTIALKWGYIGVYIAETCLLCYYYYGAVKSAPSSAFNLGCVQTQYVGIYSSLSLSSALVPIATAPIVVLNFTLLSVVLCTVFPLARQARGLTETPLFGALIRDGVAYFALTTCATLLATITPLVYYNIPRAVSLSIPWFLSVGPVSAGRLFLNLRSIMGSRNSVGISNSPPPTKPSTSVPSTTPYSAGEASGSA